MWYDDDDNDPLDKIRNPVWIRPAQADSRFLAWCRAMGVDLRVTVASDKNAENKIASSADDLQTLIARYHPAHEQERFC